MITDIYLRLRQKESVIKEFPAGDGGIQSIGTDHDHGAASAPVWPGRQFHVAWPRRWPRGTSTENSG
jgi:hypothetical protein